MITTEEELIGFLLDDKKIYRAKITNNLPELITEYYIRYIQGETDVFLGSKEVSNFNGYLNELENSYVDFVIFESQDDFFVDNVHIKPNIFKEVYDNTPLPHELCGIISEYCHESFICWRGLECHGFNPEIKNFSGVAYLGLASFKIKKYIDECMSTNFYKIYKKFHTHYLELQYKI